MLRQKSVSLNQFLFTIRVATTKHIMVGQKYFKRGGNIRLGSKNMLNIVKQTTIQKTLEGQNCC